MRTVSLRKLSGFAALALLVGAGLLSPVHAAQPLDTIQLDNGILMRDWLDLPAVKSAQNPLETGERAVAYIKRYGPYQELLDIVWRATRKPVFAEQSITAENAAEKLAELDQARRKLGEWPQLIISHARAASLNGQPGAALADLKSWLKVVPVDDKRRKEIVALVVESETDGAAVTRHFDADAAVTRLASSFDDTTERFVTFDKPTLTILTQVKNQDVYFQYELCSVAKPFKFDVRVQWQSDVPSGTPVLIAACKGSKLANKSRTPFTSCWFDFPSPPRPLERMKVGNSLTATQASLDAARAAFLKEASPQMARFQQAFEALMAAQCK